MKLKIKNEKDFPKNKNWFKIQFDSIKWDDKYKGYVAIVKVLDSEKVK